MPKRSDLIVKGLEILAKPLQIGMRTAANRLLIQPMECNDADGSGNPSDLTFQRYRKLAEGGAGMITVESLTVTPESRARKNQIEINERSADGLARLLIAMREVNDKPLIILQINHSGAISNSGFSRVVSYYPNCNPAVHILSDEEVEDIKEMFVKTAIIAHQIGADGIDFKLAHGYFGTQLLRPANTRQGHFGGSFENRTRFFREVALRIKEQITDKSFILGTRISFLEGIPGGFGTTGPDEVAEDPTEPLSLVRMIERMGFHFINVSAGIGVMTGEICRPTHRYPEGVYRHFCWTESVKRAVSIPVIGTGYSYLRDGKNKLAGSDPDKKSLLYWAGKNIQEGRVDLVGIGRQSLADPLFARKLFSGNLDEINYCTACGNCSVLLASQARVGCPTYSRFYREELRRAKRKLRQTK